jgi:misacylated tRNA(Ala) deacylase
MEVVEANHPLTISWISDDELESNPNLVRTMSVKPPTGSGQVRMIRVGDAVDFQPCGGTHLKTTGEIGKIAVSKVENKGKKNRRINVCLVE